MKLWVCTTEESLHKTYLHARRPHRGLDLTAVQCRKCVQMFIFDGHSVQGEECPMEASGLYGQV